MKIISMYLPQFHRVKENDEWWGDGFTEWTTVKGAERCFEDHYQPHVPLENNYYDLMDRETMEWQTALMKRYQIDGQCFYHYWFKDGRKILEKPAENLLCWSEIDMPFCFCWANETWARSWSKLRAANIWALTYEKKENKNDMGILLEQEYGDVEQWRKHFDYLLPFFKDARYIKKDGKPVFMIYKPTDMPCLKEMMEKWNEWAKEQGFIGIYVIGANCGYSEAEDCVDSRLYHEPQYTRKRIQGIRREETYVLDYDEIWKELLSYQSIEKNVMYGGFVGYDDTPRHAKTGTVVENADPEKFKNYLAELIAKNYANGNDLVFINAWNEWGEGMHMEPDERFQYGFLEAVPYAKERYKEYIAQYQRDDDKIRFYIKKEMEELTDKSKRYAGYWRILDAWLSMQEAGVSIERYFIDHNIRSVAIYGMGMLGKHLFNELLHSNVEIRYAIDKKIETVFKDIIVYAPQDTLPEVDVIVVTATYAFEEIKWRLMQQGHKKVISLETIIQEMS